jgi:hypothetical protein
MRFCISFPGIHAVGISYPVSISAGVRNVDYPGTRSVSIPASVGVSVSVSPGSRCQWCMPLGKGVSFA